MSFLPTRKQLRAPGFDYSSPGWYMVTICTHRMEHHFGKVRDGLVHHNTAGEIADRCWRGLPRRFPITLDAYVVMPNHLHGIVVLTEDSHAESISLGRVIGAYKSLVSVENISCVHAGMLPSFDGTLWLRGFRDQIIRDDRMLDAMRNYIAGNPGRWTEQHEAGA